MLILCPTCKKKTEIEHVERGRRVVCGCGEKFTLNDQTVISDYSQLDEPPPEMIGPYPVTRLIGHGGMGKVYLGTHPQLNLPVAIKVLPAQYATDPGSKERFVKTARISAKLQHQNVVCVYDFGTMADGAPYLVLEYVSGGTLYEQLRDSGPLSPTRVAEVGCSVCSALSQAARAGIVHRDVKPDNIMLTQDRICKLSDLGLAKITLDENAALRAKRRYQAEATGHGGLGTPEYTAPEQSLDAKNCDIRADIYSLGITMYELVTGKLPFDSHDSAELRRMHLEAEPTPAHELRPDLPSMLEYIISRCIKKNPEERYQTPEELRADLEAFLADTNSLPSIEAVHNAENTEDPETDLLTDSGELEELPPSELEDFMPEKKKTEQKAAGILPDKTRLIILLIVLVAILLLWLGLVIYQKIQRDAVMYSPVPAASVSPEGSMW